MMFFQRGPLLLLELGSVVLVVRLADDMVNGIQKRSPACVFF